MMYKILVATLMLALLHIQLAQAADVNSATAFQLEATRGIGEAMAKRIVDERAAHGDFKSWADFAARVKGVGDKSLKTMQADGLTLSSASQTISTKK